MCERISRVWTVDTVGVCFMWPEQSRGCILGCIRHFSQLLFLRFCRTCTFGPSPASSPPASSKLPGEIGNQAFYPDLPAFKQVFVMTNMAGFSWLRCQLLQERGAGSITDSASTSE